MSDVVKDYVLEPGTGDFLNTRKHVISVLLHEYYKYSRSIRDTSFEYETQVERFNVVSKMRHSKDGGYPTALACKEDAKRIGAYLKDLKMMIKAFQAAQCKVQCVLNDIADIGLTGCCTLVITKRRKLLMSCDGKSDYGYITNFDVTVYD